MLVLPVVPSRFCLWLLAFLYAAWIVHLQRNRQQNPMSTAAILAFDSSCPTASIALSAGGKRFTRELAQSTHARELVPAIEAVLADAGLTMEDIGTIVTTLGPGSFTGIRISLAAAHGFLLAREHTLKTCTSLQAVAFEYFASHAADTCEVWLNAGKQEAYTQTFTRTRDLPMPAGEITLKPLSAVSGNAVGNIEGVKTYMSAPSANALCTMAAALPATRMEAAMPIYVRAPDAKPPAPFEWLATKS